MNPHEKVYRAFTERLLKHGFIRKKKRLWWEHAVDRVWHRIHVHKFRNSYHFRIHGALHLRPEQDEAPWLNGPYSADGYYSESKFGVRVKFLEFSFQDRDESIARCADCMAEFVDLRLIPWFTAWSDRQKLIDSPDSPLSADQKEFLKKK